MCSPFRCGSSSYTPISPLLFVSQGNGRDAYAVVVADRKTITSPIRLSINQLFEVLYPPSQFSVFASRDPTPYRSFLDKIQLDVPSGVMFWALHGPVDTQHLETCPDAIIRAMDNTNQGSATYHGYANLLTHIRARLQERKLEDHIGPLSDSDRIPEMSENELSHYPNLLRIQAEQTGTLTVDVDEMQRILRDTKIPCTDPSTCDSNYVKAVEAAVDNVLPNKMAAEIGKELNDKYITPSQMQQVCSYLEKPTHYIRDRLFEHNQGGAERIITGLVSIISIVCFAYIVWYGVRKVCRWKTADRAIATTSEEDIDWALFNKLYITEAGSNINIEITKKMHTQSIIRLAILMQQRVSSNIGIGSVFTTMQNTQTDQQACATMTRNIERLSKILGTLLDRNMQVSDDETVFMRTEKKICNMLLTAYNKNKQRSSDGKYTFGRLHTFKCARTN